MPPRFAADCNVGRLARWLRALGYDAFYQRAIADRELVRLALVDGRIILTRDLDLINRRPIRSGQVRAVLLRGDAIESQLAQVAVELDLNPALALTRCLECNLVLEPRTWSAVAERLPPHVRATQSRFSECPGCRRVYWPGTHWERMRERLVAVHG